MTEAVAAASRRECRQALEALRNGVPNRDAVRLLGCNQETAEKRFRAVLSDASEGHRGMLVSGDFGVGKSHLLQYFQEVALAENFVCSKVAVSKETPLYDLGKVFQAAVGSARMPNRTGRLIEELVELLRDSDREYALLRWAEEAAGAGSLSPIFPATLAVRQRSGDPELTRAVDAYWSGDRIRVADVRKGLREIDQLRNYPFRAPRAAELPPQRLRFVLELVRAAGYSGWVVLLDELELIGSYTILQRGRAYSEVARWLGRFRGDAYRGLAVAGTLTEDFASAVISADGKQDCDNIGPRLRNNPRHAHLETAAFEGMRALERDCIALRPPTDEDVAGTVERLRAIYARAHDWDPPPRGTDASGAGFEGRMRYKVRSAINAWDVLRLVPGARPVMETREFAPSYVEDPDLEGERDDEADETPR